MSVDDEKAELERPAPKSVVKNWEALGRQYTEERNAFVRSDLVNAVKDPYAPRWEERFGVVPSKLWLLPERTVYQCCFETALTSPSLVKIYQAFVELPERKTVDITDDEYFDEKQMSRFRRKYYFEWWIRTFTDYPIYLHYGLNSSFYDVVDGAVCELLNGGTLYESYGYMAKFFELRKAVVDRQLKREKGVS